MARPGSADRYVRHRPEQTLFYQLVERHYPAFVAHMEAQGQTLPSYLKREFDEFLRCGRLEYGFLRVQCGHCHDERLVETAAWLVDEVLPRRPMRQWVLSFPFPLRFLLASYPAMAPGLHRPSGGARAQAPRQPHALCSHPYGCSPASRAS